MTTKDEAPGARRRTGRDETRHASVSTACQAGPLIAGAWSTVSLGIIRAARSSVVAIATLGLSVGLGAAVFAVVDSVYIRALPFKDPSRLVRVWKTQADSGLERVSFPEFAEWREQNEVFESIGAWEPAQFGLFEGSATRQLAGAFITVNLTEVLKTPPVLGRCFRAGDELLGLTGVAMLSESTWRSAFQSDPHIVGRRVSVRPSKGPRGVYEVVGVLPAAFHLGASSEGRRHEAIYLPYRPPTGDPRSLRRAASLVVVARLKPGVQRAQADAQMRALSKTLYERHASTVRGTVVVRDLRQDVLGDSAFVGGVVVCAVVVVVILGCLNLSDIMMMRVAREEKEMRIRAARGASPLGVARHVLAHALMVSAWSACVGAALAIAAIRVIAVSGGPGLPGSSTIRFDDRVGGVVILLALGGGVLSAVVPILLSLRGHVDRAGMCGLSRAPVAGFHSRGIALAVQSLLIVVLLQVTGLLVGTVRQLLAIPLGFDADRVIAAEVWLPRELLGDVRPAGPHLQGVVARVAALPGIEEAAYATALPFTAGPQFEVEFPDGRRTLAVVYAGGPFLQRALGIPVLRGRTLGAGDGVSGSAVVISDSLCGWFSGDPIGQTINMGRRYQVVGIARSTTSLEGDPTNGTLATGRPREIYAIDDGTTTQLRAYVVARTVTTSVEPATGMGEALAYGSHDVAIGSVGTLGERVRERFRDRLFEASLLSIFSLVALVLAAVGIYGMLASHIERRQRDDAVRLALGATPGEVRQRILARTATTVLIGTTLGVLASGLVSQVVRAHLYGLTPNNLEVTVVSSTATIVAALAAAWSATRRLRTVDPVGLLSPRR